MGSPNAYRKSNKYKAPYSMFFDDMRTGYFTAFTDETLDYHRLQTTNLNYTLQTSCVI